MHLVLITLTLQKKVCAQKVELQPHSINHHCTEHPYDCWDKHVGPNVLKNKPSGMAVGGQMARGIQHQGCMDEIIGWHSCALGWSDTGHESSLSIVQSRILIKAERDSAVSLLGGSTF